ncbi:LRR receptor-like serine/threonine-protein kinase SIK1 isoform X2 [Jatropha curcas]|uniref:LRR receptor-like serine/threonine-protein kinase SIK1 isoform X2 n=1 Tax=Jatropha curcas TaxID=180498 RepID=UPI0018946314|nr:LRR receptor-like serine/threonine-protein kinase SIK1 isoform X2 [Jatropha curcas]
MVVFEAANMESELFKAALSGNVGQLLLLLRENPDVLVDSAMVTANTPLHIAAANGHCEFVRTMLSYKSSFAWELNEDGFTALNLAIEKGHIDIVKYLLLHDPGLRMLKDSEGRTSLHCAAIHGKTNIINELLMEFEDCLDERTARGETVLHLALKYNKEEAFVVLMNWVKQTQKEKLLDLKDKAGSTVLELAQSKKKNKAIIQLIMRMKCSQKLDNEIGIKMVKLNKDHQLEDTLFIGVLSILVLSLFFCVTFFSETTEDQAYSNNDYKVFISAIEVYTSENFDNEGVIFTFAPDAEYQHLIEINIDGLYKEFIQLKTGTEISDQIDNEIGMDLPQIKKEQMPFTSKITELKDCIFSGLLPVLGLVCIAVFNIIMSEIIEKNIKPPISLMSSFKLPLSTVTMYFAWAATGLCFIKYLTEDMTAISIIVLLLAVASTFSLLYSILKINKELEQRQKTWYLLEDCGALSPAIFTVTDLEEMTNNFSRKLGEGYYGTVYKGYLKNGVPVAVKRLNDSSLRKEDLFNEICVFGRIHHINVVRLLGICIDASVLLVYEYMANRSLDCFLFSPESAKFSWDTRYNVAMGLAKGLQYLHEESELSIIHGDLKPENILLDSNFNPKITDFGLSRLFSKKILPSVTGVRGRRAYTAPELWSSGNATCKSDIYGFGVLLLEIVGGRRLLDARVETEGQDYFPVCAYKCLEKGEDMGTKEEIAKKLAIVAFWCTQKDPADRPPMQVVIRMLEDNIGNLTTPPNPFAFADPIRSP